MGAAVQILCEEITDVLAACHVQQLELFSAQLILQPQVGHGEVPHSPEAPARANADGCSTVSVDPQGHLKAEVSAEGLQAKAFACSLADPCQFGLGR